MTHRSNENDGVHFRSERVFAVNGEWYFQVRDIPAAVGPFASRERAEKVLATFVSDINSNLTLEQAMLHLRLVKDAFAEDDF